VTPRKPAGQSNLVQVNLYLDPMELARLKDRLAVARSTVGATVSLAALGRMYLVKGMAVDGDTVAGGTVPHASGGD